MRWLLSNPMTKWLRTTVRSKILERKNYKKSLKLGYMVNISNCSFGTFNTIYDYSNLTHVSLDSFTYISYSTNISHTTIGKYCSIGARCNIGLGIHPSKQFVSTHPMFYSLAKQNQITFAKKNYFKEHKEITIGHDVWIGANVIVLDGVNISTGAIIAAGAVVVKDVPPYAIVGGNPANIIKYRFSKKEIELLLEDCWWDKDIELIKETYTNFHNINHYFSTNSK